MDELRTYFRKGDKNMSDEMKTELASVVAKLSELAAERKTIMERYNASSAESKTLRVRRAELEVEVAKAKAAKRAETTKTETTAS